MHQKYRLMIFFCLAQASAFSGETIDSIKLELQSKIKKAVSIPDKVSANYTLANYLAETDSILSERYFEAGYKLAVKENHVPGQAKYFYYRGARKYNLGRFSESEELCRQSLVLLHKTTDTVLTLHAIGLMLNSMDYQSKDISREKEHLDFFERTAFMDQRTDRGSNVARGFIYSCLANYYTQKDNEKSRQAYLKEYECYQKVNNKDMLMSFHSNFAHFNLFIKNYPLAIQHARTAVTLSRELKDNNSNNDLDFMLTSISLAEMLISQGEFDEATRIFNEVVNISTQMRQDLIDSEQKDHQLELALARQQSDRYIFLIIIASSVLLIILLFILLRRHYHLKALRQEITLKERVAMDLHDEAGTMITKTIFLAQDILQSDRNPDPRLRQIMEQSLQLNASFRDAIWSADKRTDELLNLVDRIIEAGHKMTDGTRFAFHVQKTGELPNRMMKAIEKRNIMLVVREALHNATKHSEGDSIQMKVDAYPDKLIISIMDNGNAPAVSNEKYGMGLHSMKHRAQKMGAELFAGQMPEGFTVQLTVKLDSPTRGWMKFFKKDI